MPDLQKIDKGNLKTNTHKTVSENGGKKGRLSNLFFEILKPDKDSTTKENYKTLTFHVDTKF